MSELSRVQSVKLASEKDSCRGPERKVKVSCVIIVLDMTPKL